MEITVSEALGRFEDFLQAFDLSEASRKEIERQNRWGGLASTGLDVGFGKPGIWAGEAAVHIRMVQPNGEYPAVFKVIVNWSACNRSTALAASAIKAYQEALDFALQCEAFFESLPKVVVAR